MIMKKKYIALVILFLYNLSFGSENDYFIANSLRTRPLALGGAYLSVKENIYAMDYNPAAFSVSSVGGDTHFSLFFNPVAIPIITSNFKEFEKVDIPLGLLVHGLALSYKKVNIGIIIGEETITNISRLKNKKMTALSGYSVNRKSSLCFSLELASRVSIGIAGDCFYHTVDNKRLIKFGYRYGIWIKTLKEICLGLCFFDLPQQFSEDRLELDRFDDETLNIGFSYSPWNFIQFALDIRNVSEDKKAATGEPHLGINLIPWKHLSLQGGYFQENKDSRIVSFGFGLLNENYLLSEEKRLKQDEFILNAALIWKRGVIETDRWFMITSIIRI